MARLLPRLALAAVELTALPLLAVGTAYVLSGLQMLHPWLGVFGSPAAVHGDRLLRALLIALGGAHSWGGLVLVCERRVRPRRLRLALEWLITALIAAGAAALLAAELV